MFSRPARKNTTDQNLLRQSFISYIFRSKRVRRVQLSLWSFDCGLLWTWDSGCVRVLDSQASSETLKYWCDPGPVILGSCCPKILDVLQCLEVVSPLRIVELSGLFETKVKQNWSKGTQASGQEGLWCPCSCCHRPVTIGLEQMLCTTHQWS